jgi:peptidoglycan/LPS O-acetylase OafA/YrhL
VANKPRIPSLDGLRAISLSIVVFVHLLGRDFAWLKFDIALFAMFIFFGLSGFLITRLLIEEREQTGVISVSSFYGRRFFRIFPALAGYLCGLALMSRLGLAACSPRELYLGLTFVANYRYSGFLSLGHLWSLSVEEQFYLLWPLVFARFSNKHLCRLLIGVICGVPFIRLWHLAHGGDWMALQWHSESLADTLAAGCLLAFVQPQLRRNRFYQWFTNSPVCMLTPLFILVAGWQWSPLFYQLIGKSVMLILIVLGMDILVQRFDSNVGRVLNTRLLVKLGIWSYSIYLWQQVFAVAKTGTQPYAWFPVNLALILLTGISSFYLIEQPMLRWGRNLIGKRPTSTANRILERTA